MKLEAPENAAAARGEDRHDENPSREPENAADRLQVQAGPADVSTDVAADASAAPSDVAGRSEHHKAISVAVVEDVGTHPLQPIDSAATEGKSDGGTDALVTGTTDGAVVMGVEGIQNAESVPEASLEAAPTGVVGAFSEPAVPEQE